MIGRSRVHGWWHKVAPEPDPSPIEETAPADPLDRVDGFTVLSPLPSHVTILAPRAAAAAAAMGAQHTGPVAAVSVPPELRVLGSDGPLSISAFRPDPLPEAG